MTKLMDEALKLSLHNKPLGYLLAHKDGRTRFVFDKNYIANAERATFTLASYNRFPNAQGFLNQEFHSNMRLIPSLSNLLPEGALRDYLTSQLKIHPDHEFQLFKALGNDLPGALVATSVATEDLPDYLQAGVKIANDITSVENETENKFSLAGVQMKMSLLKQGNRFTLANSNQLGDWIIKTPSPSYPHLPENEFTAMKMAALIGVNIPDAQLVDLAQIDWANQSPDSNQQAFAIKRFDRNGRQRIHQEDFAQVLLKHPHQKYSSANSEQLATIVHRFSSQPLEDIRQLTLQMLANILLANGDAHIKNFSLIYPDQVNPQLSPAYDIVTTGAYINNESDLALNFAKQKNWYQIDESSFKHWAKRADLPWALVSATLKEGLEKAQELWPTALKDLPAPQAGYLQEHWRRLKFSEYFK